MLALYNSYSLKFKTKFKNLEMEDRCTSQWMYWISGSLKN